MVVMNHLFFCNIFQNIDNQRFPDFLYYFSLDYLILFFVSNAPSTKTPEANTIAKYNPVFAISPVFGDFTLSCFTLMSFVVAT